jgi:hypothetical protein
VSQLESESTHGKGKPGLQASLTLMKKFKHKGFLCLHSYFICQLSSVQPYTRKPDQATHSGGREMKISQRRNQNRIYMQSKVGNPDIKTVVYVVIYHTLCTSPQHTHKKGVYIVTAKFADQFNVPVWSRCSPESAVADPCPLCRRALSAW